ncbi:hypothetical protein ACFV20_21605 [Streptomyces sp. NPDC059696]|uniref:hypothetical protein n=1 Tax=Streptomyces sp. NPDC059696 TaxID=3346911 RepID=UPI0036A9B9A0
MGIRTFLSRTGTGMALPPVPAFEAAASTVRVPVTLTSALRHATVDLRRRLARGGRATGSAGTGAPAAAARPNAGDLTAAPALTGTEALAALTALTGTEALSALTALADTEALAALTGLAENEALAALAGLTGTDALAVLAGVIDADSMLTVADLTAVTGDAPAGARRPRTPAPPGKPCRPWARLARDYLAFVLTLLPRPRPARTTITVYITTSDGFVSERPDDSAPHRWPGQDRWGPEPDAAP